MVVVVVVFIIVVVVVVLWWRQCSVTLVMGGTRQQHLRGISATVATTLAGQQH